LQRVIQKYIKDELALELLDGSIDEGDEIVVDYEGDQFNFTVK